MKAPVSSVPSRFFQDLNFSDDVIRSDQDSAICSRDTEAEMRNEGLKEEKLKYGDGNTAYTFLMFTK